MKINVLGDRFSPDESFSRPGGLRHEAFVRVSDLKLYESWNGGLSPDDVDARLKLGRAALDARHAELQKILAARGIGVSLVPFLLIQDNCWVGEPGWFLLYVLELNPFDEWNVIFLPEDESGARLLNAPLHPRSSIPDFAASGEAFILERKQVLLKLHAQARRLRSFVAFNEARASAIEDVKALAESFMGRLLEGDRAVGDGPRLPEV